MEIKIIRKGESKNEISDYNNIDQIVIDKPQWIMWNKIF